MEKFTTKELISQATFSASYEALLRDGPEATGVFSRWLDRQVSVLFKRFVSKVIEYVACRDEAGDKRWADLKARVVEHNIRSWFLSYMKVSTIDFTGVREEHPNECME